MAKDTKLTAFIGSVFEFLKTLPEGKVVSYGEVARQCGVPLARNVSWILRQNNNPDKVPCYKIVRSDGSLAKGYKFGGLKEQKKRLMEEGVKFGDDGKIKNFMANRSKIK